MEVKNMVLRSEHVIDLLWRMDLIPAHGGNEAAVSFVGSVVPDVSGLCC